jgi:hypothetical protein
MVVTSANTLTRGYELRDEILEFQLFQEHQYDQHGDHESLTVEFKMYFRSRKQTKWKMPIYPELHG